MAGRARRRSGESRNGGFLARQRFFWADDQCRAMSTIEPARRIEHPAISRPTIRDLAWNGRRQRPWRYASEPWPVSSRARYHGLLVAALPAPLGRMVMLNHLLERARLNDKRIVWLGDEHEVAGSNAVDRGGELVEFRLELGLPIWIYDFDGTRIEKRLLMPHGQNTTHLTYRLNPRHRPRQAVLASVRPFSFFTKPRSAMRARCRIRSRPLETGTRSRGLESCRVFDCAWVPGTACGAHPR